MIIHEIAEQLLLEQDSKIDTLRKSILERIPVTINYSGPPEEVTAGQRIDIEPIVLGKNRKSGNLVIWAYVFKGVSRKGLPGWKMFRVDRIQSVDYNLEADKFELGSLPGYQKGKAPNAMKSLSSVDIFSPYWFDDKEEYAPKPETVPQTIQAPEEPEPVEPQVTEPEISKPEPTPTQEPISPEISNENLPNVAYDQIKDKIKDINGRKLISPQDYDASIRDIYNSKEGQWKNYQRQIGGNVRPGEGTRRRFNNTSKTELDSLLAKNNINVSNDANIVSEARKKFLRLINW